MQRKRKLEKGGEGEEKERNSLETKLTQPSTKRERGKKPESISDHDTLEDLLVCVCSVREMEDAI